MQDLNEILVFAAVVETGSFTAAARKLDMPKSTVSRKLSLLEQRLGAQLLQRTTRTLSLTDVGRAYHRHARRIADELVEAEHSVSCLQDAPRGLLRVTVPADFDSLRPVLSSFLKRYPDVRIDVLSSDRVVDIIEEGFDVAVRAGALRDSTLIARRLATMRNHVVASPDFIEEHEEPREPEQIEGLPGILFGSGPARTGWLLENEAVQHKVCPQPRIIVNDYSMVRAQALAGVGVAMIPADLIIEDLRAERLCHLLPAWSSPPVPLHAVYAPTRHISPKLKAFLDHLHGAMSACPWQLP